MTTILSMLFRRKAVACAWVAVFGLFAFIGAPMTAANGTLLFVVGIVPPLVMLVLSKQRSPTVAEVLYHVETPRTPR